MSNTKNTKTPTPKPTEAAAALTRDPATAADYAKLTAAAAEAGKTEAAAKAAATEAAKTAAKTRAAAKAAEAAAKAATDPTEAAKLTEAAAEAVEADRRAAAALKVAKETEAAAKAEAAAARGAVNEAEAEAVKKAKAAEAAAAKAAADRAKHEADRAAFLASVPATPKTRPAGMTEAAYEKLVDLDDAIRAYNDHQTEAAAEAVTTAAKALKGQTIADRAAKLAKVAAGDGVAAMWKTYLTDPTVKTYSITKTQYGFTRSKTAEDPATVSFSALDTAATVKNPLIRDPKWREALKLTAFHACKHFANEDPEAAAAFSMVNFNPKNNELYLSVDNFAIYGRATDPKTSANAIQKQLDDIVSRLLPADMTLPSGLPFTVRAADRRAFLAAVKGYRRDPAKRGMTFRAASTTVCEAALLDLMVGRYNDLAITIDGGVKAKTTTATAGEVKTAKAAKTPKAKTAKKPTAKAGKKTAAA